MRHLFNYNKLKIAVFFLLISLTVFSEEIDLFLSLKFFDVKGYFAENSFTKFMYTWGILPGQILISSSFILFLFSFCSKKCRHLKLDAGYIFISIFLGAVILVHGLGKDHINRPRPRQVTQFGGEHSFRPFYQPKITYTPSKFKSFPCGHCTMGFCFFSIAYFFKQKEKERYFTASLYIATFYGSLIGVVRIAQGGHFLTDVIFSGVIMWASSYVSYLFFRSFSWDRQLA